jgi:DEAD/DEAH box helicase domain-containing protein
VTEPSLAALARTSWYRGQLVHIAHRDRTEARCRPPREPLPPPLEALLAERGIATYTHQADVVDRCRAGEDVLVATQTASGKSLAYNLVVAEALLCDPDATALYLFPTKALAHDQLEELVALDEALGLRAEPAAYDGDTPRSARARIRSRSRIVVSNPYGLHEYLPQAQALERFISHLAVVVVDEAHRYRGVFGSHVALVLRRLLRICDRLGARPRLVLSSATVANPAEHGRELTGRQVTVVDDDGAPAAERTVALWDSMHDPDRSAAAQSAQLVASLAERGVRTLCFAGSRVGVELVAGWAADRAPGARISPYRAGYTPAERRQIEADLRDGTLDAVVCTNALELGIDIGGLDAVVLTGYPGTIASTWQQLGRAGRGDAPALGILVAGDDPLDQYFVRRPAALFSEPVERAVLSLENPEVLAGQVLCAAAELPVRSGDAAFLGGSLGEVLDNLAAGGLVASGPAGHTFTGSFRPASAVRLDGRGEAAVEVRVDGVVVEVLERWRACREAHEGAILVHLGQRYRVRSLDLDSGRAEAVSVWGPEHTEATVTKEFTLGTADLQRPAGAWAISLGPTRIRQQVVAYKLRLGDDVLSTTALDLPPAELHTRSLWAEPEVDLATILGPGDDARGALHAAEHALIHAMPLLAMCDRGDAGGLSTVVHSETGRPLILLYDGYEGGAGIGDVAFSCFDELTGLALSMVASCDCERGCPRCVYDRACGNENQPMDRLGALEVLRSMRQAASSAQ